MASDPTGIIRALLHLHIHLFTGQMAADPRLGPLADLNFHKLGVIQIILMHTEAAGGHLYHGTVAVRRQVLGVNRPHRY